MQVLQQVPAQATVWGFVPDGQSVSVSFNGQTVAATTGEWHGNNTFLAKLPPTTASLTTAHNITATSNGQTITLANVLFGDVWVCSGQSNMEVRRKKERRGEGGRGDSPTMLQAEFALCCARARARVCVCVCVCVCGCVCV
jgi:hypothetical protein